MPKKCEVRRKPRNVISCTTRLSCMMVYRHFTVAEKKNKVEVHILVRRSAEYDRRMWSALKETRDIKSCMRCKSYDDRYLLGLAAVYQAKLCIVIGLRQLIRPPATRARGVSPDRRSDGEITSKSNQIQHRKFWEVCHRLPQANRQGRARV